MGIEKIIQESTTNHKFTVTMVIFVGRIPRNIRGGQVPGQVPCDEPLVPCEPREVSKKLEHGFKEHPGVMGFYIGTITCYISLVTEWLLLYWEFVGHSPIW